jgi:hypothetical protein
MPGASPILERIDAMRQAGLLVIEHGGAGARVIGGVLLRLADLSADVLSFEAEADLQPGWRSEARRARRDAMLIDLRRRRFPDLAARPAAVAIEIAGCRYAASGWRRDRRAGRRPDGLSGDLYDLLSICGMPGREALRRLFSAVSG